MAAGRIDSLEKELRRSLEGEVRFDPGSRALYATDASNYRQIPVGVIVPRHEDDVINAVRLASENEVAILARGGGTSLAGQACNAALVLDFSKYMNSIISVDAERRLAVVEPGIVQAQLNAELARHGLFFAPDPSTKDRCTIGGMIGNNSCGAHSAAYGKTVDNVAELEVLLYDGTRLRLGANEKIAAASGRMGELYRDLAALRDRYAELIRERYPTIPRRVSGYNLDQLLPENGFNLARAVVGSECTLALTLRATLELAPRPATTALVVLGFENLCVAADQVPWLLEHRPEALEGFDHHFVDFGRRRGFQSVKLLPAGSSFLIVEFGADHKDAARERAEELRQRAVKVGRCLGAAVMVDDAEQRAVWSLRESGVGSRTPIEGYPRTWPGAEDTAVPPARLGAYLRRFIQLLRRHGLEAGTYYGHLGEGCLHCSINFDLMNRRGVAQFRSVMTEIASLVIEFGGSLSGEHGDGLSWSELLPKMFGTELVEAFGGFKRAFDPQGRMNPGVIVNPHPLDSHLRLGESYRPKAVTSHFDFGSDGGLPGAALRCAGLGKCRKLEGGTMCPSYMATREEMHSTRGRARLLHEALAGDFLKGGGQEQAVFAALELCLSCKACKTECPAAVDMATYKAEFLAHFYQANRRPLQSRFFGRIHELARAASRFPAVVNSITQARAPASFLRLMLGIHPERALPRFAARSFRQWFHRGRHPANPNGPQVIFFPDTFSNFFEPEVAIAAVEVLERSGFQVTIPPRDLCCGRPLFDQGMLGTAKRRLEEVMAVIAPFAQLGVPIVGVEPSCILTFRDELPALFPDRAEAQALKGGTFMLDEFFSRDAANSLSGLELHHRALLHGHCHQKAIVGLEPELKVLGRIKGLEVKPLDSGCCGMAGAFGYGAERFDVSRKIGERVLLPEVGASAPDTIIVADGYACRTQIRQFCPERRPLHLAQLLNAAAVGREK